MSPAYQVELFFEVQLSVILKKKNGKGMIKKTDYVQVRVMTKES